MHRSKPRNDEPDVSSRPTCAERGVHDSRVKDAVCWGWQLYTSAAELAVFAQRQPERSKNITANQVNVVKLHFCDVETRLSQRSLVNIKSDDMSDAQNLMRGGVTEKYRL